MNANPVPPPRPDVIVYPESDGLPIADNTRQLRWIMVLQGKLAAQYRLRPDVFVTSNVFWYPVQGEPEVRVAPDTFVVFGRPKGDRGSYMQWKEADVPVTVAFEVLSPGNRYGEVIDKQHFYEDHGVEEFYVYDPDANRLWIYVRQGAMLLRQPYKGFVSPRLGIRFEFTADDMIVYRADGKLFFTFEELEAMHEDAERRAEEAEERAEDESLRANDAELRAETAEERARMALRFAELTRTAAQGTATPEEVQELSRLEAELFPPRA